MSFECKFVLCHTVIIRVLLAARNSQKKEREHARVRMFRTLHSSGVDLCKNQSEFSNRIANEWENKRNENERVHA